MLFFADTLRQQPAMTDNMKGQELVQPSMKKMLKDFQP